MTEVDAFLEHHGIKGQKWGIRNKKQKAPKTLYEKQRRNQKIIYLGTSAAILGMAFMNHRMKTNLARRRMNNAFAERAMRDKQALDFIERAKKYRPRYRPRSIPMGPVGSSGVSRLGGAIPL